MTLTYKDDVGARISVSTGNTTMPVDTILTLIIKKPLGTILTKTPSVNFTTGVLTYDTIAGDVDQAGEYQVQVKGVFSDGDILTSDIDRFPVYRKLE